MGPYTGEQLAILLRESVSDPFLGLQNCNQTLTCHAVRFVDRDMFMRYRGGGIGHRYMREIEEIYENMTRERIHHREHSRADTVNNSGSDDECEPEGSTNPRAGRATDSGPLNPPGTGDRRSGGGAVYGRAVEGDDSDFDSDYEPPGTDSEGSSEDDDMDDWDSDGEIPESYGFGEL